MPFKTKIQFKYTAYDSLIGGNYLPKSSVWTDVFIQDAFFLDQPYANPPYFSQIVQRTTTVPDIIFIADDLGGAGGVLPIISLPDTAGWLNNIPPNAGPQATPGVFLLGPGTIHGPAANTSLQYIFTTRRPFYQVQWNGPVGTVTPIEGNMNPLSIGIFQWGWITNTGPADYVMFPEPDVTKLEAIVGPAGVVPSITHIQVLDGLNQRYKPTPYNINPTPSQTISRLLDGKLENQEYKPYPFTINRTLDTVFIYGRRTDSATEIQVLNSTGSIIKQRINPRSYIMSDQLIKLPPGVFGDVAEGNNLKIRLVSAVGEGPLFELGNITAGNPLITSTPSDGSPLNTQRSLVILGAGFKTSQLDANGKQHRVYRIEFYENSDDITNRDNYESDQPAFNIAALDDNGTWTVTDTQITIPANFISDNNATAFGTLVADNSAIRSGAINPLPLFNAFDRQIRLVRSDGSRSVHRANAHKFSLIGVGGNRNVPGQIRPTIISVGTTVEENPTRPDDANRTWDRSSNNNIGPPDLLVIRGYGLDLAQFVEFVDGDGDLIQSTGALGLPPMPRLMRVGPPSFSALANGVTILPDPSLPGQDGYRIEIDPVLFGINLVPFWDTIAGNNNSRIRRVVIRTPFGTAIAPPSEWLWIVDVVP